MTLQPHPDFHNAQAIWENLPDHLQLTVRKSDILFVLWKRAEYWQLSEENEINISAFLNERQYLLRAVDISMLPLSDVGLRGILGVIELFENPQSTTRFNRA